MSYVFKGSIRDCNQKITDLAGREDENDRADNEQLAAATEAITLPPIK
jgi:hypothetical protein